MNVVKTTHVDLSKGTGIFTLPSGHAAKVISRDFESYIIGPAASTGVIPLRVIEGRDRNLFLVSFNSESREITATDFSATLEYVYIVEYEPVTISVIQQTEQKLMR